MSIRENVLVTNSIKCRLIIGSMLSAAILTGCSSDSGSASYSQLQAENQRLQEQVNRLRGAIKYTVESDLLFPSGGWQLSDRGKEIIGRVASQLAPFQEDKIVVNGYTDSVPISAALQQQGVASNQELSEKRAQSVMEYMISQGVKPDLVSAVGHGEANPFAPNDTAAGRAQNRRVELTLAPMGS